MTDSTSAPATVRFARLPRAGLLLGLSAARVACIAAAAAVLIPSLFMAGTDGRSGSRPPLWAGALALAFVRYQRSAADRVHPDRGPLPGSTSHRTDTVPGPARPAAPRRHTRPPRRRRRSAVPHRRGERDRHGPRPARADPDRGRRRPAPGIRAAVRRRAGPASARLGPRPRPASPRRAPAPASRCSRSPCRTPAAASPAGGRATGSSQPPHGRLQQYEELMTHRAHRRVNPPHTRSRCPSTCAKRSRPHPPGRPRPARGGRLPAPGDDLLRGGPARGRPRRSTTWFDETELAATLRTAYEPGYDADRRATRRSWSAPARSPWTSTGTTSGTTRVTPRCCGSASGRGSPRRRPSCTRWSSRPASARRSRSPLQPVPADAGHARHPQGQGRVRHRGGAEGPDRRHRRPVRQRRARRRPRPRTRAHQRPRRHPVHRPASPSPRRPRTSSRPPSPRSRAPRSSAAARPRRLYGQQARAFVAAALPLARKVSR